MNRQLPGDSRANHVLGLEPAPTPTRWLQRPVLTRHADRHLGAHLDKELRGLGDVLHDVAFPPRDARVDHVVVAPSGIWLVDSIHLTGRVERRAHGQRNSAEQRLYLDGVERMDLVDQLGILRHAHGRLRALDVGDVPIHRVVCVIDAVWPLMGRPFQTRDVWITWPRALSEKVRSSGLLPIARAREIGQLIRERVPEHA